MYSIEQGLSRFYIGSVFRVGDIIYRAMMGEYILYYRGKVFGRWDDDRFLVKPTKAIEAVMPDANLELPLYDTDPLNAIDRHCFWKVVRAI